MAVSIVISSLGALSYKVAWRLLSDSLKLAVDGIPDGVDLKEIEQMITIS